MRTARGVSKPAVHHVSSIKWWTADITNSGVQAQCGGAGLTKVVSRPIRQSVLRNGAEFGMLGLVFNSGRGQCRYRSPS